MAPLDQFVAIVLGVFIYIGAYQPYFFLQQRTGKRSRVLPAPLRFVDERIPLRAGWVWVYTALYYPAVVLAVVLTSPDFRRFAYTCAIYFGLLVVLTVAYLVAPVRTPEHWRKFDRHASIHHRALGLVHDWDGANNCFPSGHAAISCFTGYLLAGLVGRVPAGAFVVAVCLSCLFCKQHYIVDILGGCVVGGLCAFCHHSLFVTG